MSLSLMIFFLIIFNDYSRVKCILFCSHTDLGFPLAAESDREVQLKLNCSSNLPNIITAIGEEVQQYTIFYNCTREELSSPYHGILIDSGMSSTNKSLSIPIPCGSRCSFGGCYISGLLGSLKIRSISPLSSCFVCEDSTTTSLVPEDAVSSPTVPNLTTPEPTTSPETSCHCNCTEVHEGHNCKCSRHSLDSGCESVKMNTPITIVVTSIFVASVLLTSCLVISCALVYYNVSKSTKRRPVFTDPTALNVDKVFTLDPVDPSHQFYKSRVESFSTLLQTIGALSSSNLDLSSPSNTSDYHLSDTEGYIVCGDCSSCTCSVCNYCPVRTKLQHCRALSKEEMTGEVPP